VQRIAVIQDGTELVRQTDADVADCYERCCTLLSADGTLFVPQSCADDTVGNLLEHLDPEQYGCLVIASNALLSERVGNAVERNAARLHSYLTAGGGLVVLHQLVDSLASVLPGELCPGLASRQSARGAGQAVACGLDDPLLNYPATVALDRFRDGGGPAGPPSLFYKSMPTASLPEKLLPVITYGEEILLARSYDHIAERVVIATMPLDWQDQVGLLANAIRFACLGRPRRLVWQERTGTRGALLVRWLSMDGGTSVRQPPAPGGADIGPAEQWLLRNVDLAFAPRGELDSVCARPQVQQFLDAGGTLLADDQAPGAPANRIVALIGKYTERRLANRLYGELRAVGGWDSADYAFELRNIVLALCLLWSDPANRTPVAVTPGELARLKPLLRHRLTTQADREDLSSSIAHAQSLAFLSGQTQPGQTLPDELYAWMPDDPRHGRFDVGLQIRAVAALATRRPDAGFLAAAAEALERQADLGSIAPVIRILDTVAVLDQAGLLPADAPAVPDLARLACEYLEEQGDEPDDGWLSVEATADVARGLVVLLDRLDGAEGELAERVAATLGAAMSVLRQSFGRYQRNRKGVAWLAGLTHAVVAAERRFPIGLQRLSTVDWPERSDDDQGAAGTGLPLLEHLAVENKGLRDREREFDAERLAARLGRATATLGVMALIAGPLAYAFVLVGTASAGQLIGNTVLLTGLVGIIAVALSLLRRGNLLARPAARVLDWITTTIPPLAWLGGRKDT
jgi:hypothetical protein